MKIFLSLLVLLAFDGAALAQKPTYNFAEGYAAISSGKAKFDAAKVRRSVETTERFVGSEVVEENVRVAEMAGDRKRFWSATRNPKLNAGAAVPTSETIFIGKDEYRMNDGVWRKIGPDERLPMISPTDDVLFDYKAEAGRETIGLGGQTVTRYWSRATFRTEGSEVGPLHYRASAFDVDSTGRLVREVHESGLESPRQPEDRRTVVYEYDPKDISIVEPSIGK